MLLWDKTYVAVKPREIVIISALVGPLIRHSSGFRVAQLFLRQMVVSLLVIPRVLTLIVCI